MQALLAITLGLMILAGISRIATFSPAGAILLLLALWVLVFGLLLRRVTDVPERLQFLFKKR